LKLHEVHNKVGNSGEYILCAKQTGSHACYLIYGHMDPGEKGRTLKAGKGHEEMFLAVQGNFVVTSHANATGATSHVKEGQAFHLVGEDTYSLKNATDATGIYVMAGGHTAHGHH